jgi:hypothetical protein
MTNEEVQAWLGKPVRLTLSDGRLLAGTLHAEDGDGHPHVHFKVVSDPIREGEGKVSELVHGAELITDIQDASDDPAAVE